MNGKPTGTGSIFHSEDTKKKQAESGTKYTIDLTKLKELYNNYELELHDIAKILECTPGVIQNLARKNNFYLRNRKSLKSPKFSIIEVQKMFYEENKSFSYIAKIIGVSHITIRNYIKKYDESYRLENPDAPEIKQEVIRNKETFEKTRRYSKNKL